MKVTVNGHVYRGFVAFLVWFFIVLPGLFFTYLFIAAIFILILAIILSPVILLVLLIGLVF